MELAKSKMRWCLLRSKIRLLLVADPLLVGLWMLNRPVRVLLMLPLTTRRVVGFGLKRVRPHDPEPALEPFVVLVATRL